MRKSILLASFTPNSRATGMGKWSHEMADALEAKGWEPILWFDQDFPAFAKRPRLQVLFFPVALAMRILQKRRRLGAVVVHEPSGFWYGAIRRVWRSLPPMISMSHGIETRIFRDMETASAKGFAEVSARSSLITRATRFWQSDGALRMASHVICLSSLDAEYTATRLRVPRRSVTLMINGVGSPFGHPEQRNGHDRSVVFVGGWLDAKGKRLLPEIWKRTKDRFPDAQLSIVGTGCSKELVERDFDATLRNSVRVVSSIENQEDMAAHYLSHNVFLMPSLREGSPLSLLEAMASGLIPVASRVGGIPDIVKHGMNGLLFDSMDVQGAVDQLTIAFTQPEATSQIRAAAVDTASRLTWSSSACALETAIAEALRSHQE